jgi:hypothetical protein
MSNKEGGSGSGEGQYQKGGEGRKEWGGEFRWLVGTIAQEVNTEIIPNAFYVSQYSHCDEPRLFSNGDKNSMKDMYLQRTGRREICTGI